MIQRIQSVFLLLASVALILMFNFPVVKSTGNPNVFLSINEMKAEDGTVFPMEGKYIFYGLVILCIILLLAAIGMFKNRKFQMNLVRLAVFFELGILASLFYYIDVNHELVGQGYQMSYGIGYLLPIAAVILSFLGLHFINKDEKLVRSVDRLR